MPPILLISLSASNRNGSCGRLVFAGILGPLTTGPSPRTSAVNPYCPPFVGCTRACCPAFTTPSPKGSAEGRTDFPNCPSGRLAPAADMEIRPRGEVLSQPNGAALSGGRFRVSLAGLAFFPPPPRIGPLDPGRRTQPLANWESLA